MAFSYGVLGSLARARGRVEDAMEWTARCVSLFDEFPHPMTGAGPKQLARLTAALGIEALERCWQRITGQPLPQAVRDFVTAHPDQNAE